MLRSGRQEQVAKSLIGEGFRAGRSLQSAQPRPATPCRPSSSSFPRASACAPRGPRCARRRPERAPARVRLRHERRRPRRRGAGPLPPPRCCRRRPVVDRRAGRTPTSAGTASRCRRRRRRACAPRSSACSRKRCSRTPRRSTSRSRRGAVAGQPTWVAAVDRPWLRDELAALQQAARVRRPRRADGLARRPADRPLLDAPTAASRHAERASSLTWAHTDGVATVRLQGGLARALVPHAGAADDALERSAGGRRRGRAMARRAGQRDADRAAPAAGRAQPLEPAPVRPRAGAPAARARCATRCARFDEPGLAAGAHRRRRCSCVAQIVGLNLWAWHQRSAVESRRARDAGARQDDLPARRATATSSATPPP